MVRGKKGSQPKNPKCRKCGIKLVIPENWCLSMKRDSNYICRGCRNKQSREYDEKLRGELLAILGDKCFLCGRKVGRGRLGICFHEKHGKPHNYTNFKYILEHIEDFIPLCRSCHFTLHSFAKNPERLLKLKRLIKMVLEGRRKAIREGVRKW